MVSCTCGSFPNPAKVPNSKYKHDGTLSIGNFMLMMKKPKKCAYCFRGTRNFLFFLFLIILIMHIYADDVQVYLSGSLENIIDMMLTN
jgi:hypothetical protein